VTLGELMAFAREHDLAPESLDLDLEIEDGRGPLPVDDWQVGVRKSRRLVLTVRSPARVWEAQQALTAARADIDRALGALG
jgi:hypothetical protein